MKRCIYLTYYVAFVLLLIGAPAIACETRHLSIIGNLKHSSPLANISRIPDMSTNPSFTEVSEQAQFSTSLPIFDSLGIAHTASIYFYHVAPRIWTIRVVADGAELTGGTAGRPVLLGPDIGFIFTPFGLRQSVGTPDSILTPQWVLGAPGSIRLLYPFTQTEEISSVFSSWQDGQVGECARRRDLDFDGDGIEDKAIWRRKYGIWAVLSSSTGNQLLFKQWGLPGDYPMPGDYTGDGRPDLVVWRPLNGNWYICRSETFYDCNQPIIQQFGLNGDRPIRADFDGDSMLDFAVWRPRFGNFYVLESATGKVVVRQWGLPGDIPLNSGPNT